jgi:LuxR family maltose regulon positive regulatory protein
VFPTAPIAAMSPETALKTAYGRRQSELALIRSKFSRPASRTAFVERPRLLDRLDDALDQHWVILVSAPPGFGKTTLATQWLARQGVPAAWLALDRSDSDPERFVRYLVAAIEDGTPHLLQRTAAVLAAPVPFPFDYLCDVLVSELAEVEARLILTIDDYHRVGSKQVHSLMERLVQTMPPSINLLVLSRVDPPWPLGHWRAQGWLGELRARDLRFSLEEARRFFEKETGTILSNGAIEEVYDILDNPSMELSSMFLPKYSLCNHTVRKSRLVRDQKVGQFR